MADPARTTDMTLSEAIRLGAMLRPQGRMALLRDGKTCALGAALEAIGTRLVDGPQDQDEPVYRVLKDRWPILRVEVIAPVTGEIAPLELAITAANDAFGWTREAIADWVSTIEPSQPIAEPVTVRVEIEV